MTEQGKVANRDSARLLSEGRKTEAATVLGNLLYPGIPAPVGRVLVAITARVAYSAPDIPGDVIIVAEATSAFDGREILPEITVPVLLVCGDRDRWFAMEVYEETARLIPGCTLKLYPGKDHLGAMSARRFPQDVLDFVRQHSHVPAQRDTAGLRITRGARNHVLLVASLDAPYGPVSAGAYARRRGPFASARVGAMSLA